MRVTISRRVEKPNPLERFFFSAPSTCYWVSVSIEFSHEELAVIQERNLGKYVMFSHKGALDDEAVAVDVAFFVYSASRGKQGHFDFSDFGDADEFERTARASATHLKTYITATGNAGSRTDTFEL